MSDEVPLKKLPEQEKLLIEQLIKGKKWRYAYWELLFNWGLLQKEYEDWLVGEDGIIFLLPEDVWQHLLTRLGKRNLSDSVKRKIMDRIKSDKSRRNTKEKEQRKAEKLSDGDIKAIEKKLGFSNNSIFTDKRGTMAGNDPHGYFSSNF